MAKQSPAQSTQPVNKPLGRLLSLLVIPVGIALWVILWQLGYMASLVAFGIAYGAVWLYQLGAKCQPDRKDAYFLIGVIVIGVILSFVGGMISDGWQAWVGEFGAAASFFSGDFWSFIGESLADGQLWQEYATDILIALVFAALGAGMLMRDLLKGQPKS